MQTKADQGATNNNVAAGKSERIPSYDFRAWDKFDAEKVAGKVDETEMKRGSTPIMSPKGIPLELSDIGRLFFTPPLPHLSLSSSPSLQILTFFLFEISSEKSMSSVDKENAALREKNKGNEVGRLSSVVSCFMY